MDSPQDYLGTAIDGRYRLDEYLGHGSYGYVFRAREELLGAYISSVAVKLISPQNETQRDLVRREIRGLAQLSHGCILVYRTSGEIRDGRLAGWIFLVVELADSTLEREMKEHGVLALDQTETMALCVAQALAHCHQRGAIHGDVKPANIFRVDTRWKLGDFGLIRPVQEGHAEGPVDAQQATFAYMAPELLDQQISPAADVYSLGVTILEVLTGLLAHQGDTTEEFLRNLASQPAQIPEDLEEPWKSRLARCLQRDPAARISAAELVQELGGAAAAVTAASPLRTDDLLVVSSLGRGQYLTIQDAVERARPGARIVVRPGRYRESLVIDRPVEIFGDGPVQEVVLEAAGAGCIQLRADRATIQGLTLRAAHACHATAGQASSATPAPNPPPRCYTVDVPQGTLTLLHCTVSGASLSCVAVHGPGSDLHVRGGTIERGDDAGVFLYDRGRATLEDCTVAAHGNSGVSVEGGGVIRLTRTRLHHGRASGVHVAHDGRAELFDCDIHHNAKAGVAAGTGGHAELNACRVHVNASFGVWIQEGSSGSIRECMLAENGEGPYRAPPGCPSWTIDLDGQAPAQRDATRARELS